MGAIQSSIGLITGIPIQQTVDQLIALSARPRDLLASRTASINGERQAIGQLSSLVLAFQFEANSLGKADIFSSKEVASSNEDVLAAVLSSDVTPAAGNYQFTPVRTASSQQLVSNSFEDLTTAFTQGSLSFQFGGFVDEGINLKELNSGAGFDRGQIKITDRNGASAVIDLRYASTVDDILTAINSDTSIDVTAGTSGDTLTLTDTSGGSGNLVVQEVAGKTTAASLGLSGINVASNSATGADVFSLYTDTKLSSLNGGNGVQIRSEGINDLTLTFRDESAALEIDLADSTTLGDVIDKLNAADPARLSAAIASDGNGIELTDLTAGAGTFSVASLDSGTAAEDLGIVASTTGSTISGNRVVSGLRDALLSNLNGSQGLGTLGQVDLTNRDGTLFNIDLSAAETLGDVVNAINTQTTGVTAAINSQRNGIVVTDTTGGSASNLIIANGDAENSADALGITLNDAVTSVNGGTLNRQVISEATLLADLNNGDGVGSADIRITDSSGSATAIDLNDTASPALTVGDVVQKINASGADVIARINDRGDGITIIDQAGGTATLQVEEVGSGTAAADLGILGTGVDNNGTQEITGTTKYEIDLSDLAVEGGAVLLSSLNGGGGVDRGDFIIESSELNGAENPKSIALDLDGVDSDVLTVSQLIDRINTKATASGVSVVASINANGTGILLTDTAGGEGTLSVRDVGNDTAAADLGLTAATQTSGSTQTINALGKFTTDDAAESGLNALAARINDLGAGVTAATFNDGSGFRLSLSVDKGGAGQSLLIDTGDGVISFEEVSTAQDAILEFGNAGSGILLSSDTNQFDNVVSGIDVTVKSSSTDPVTITVSESSTAVVDAVQDFVDAYNSIRSNLDNVTSFNADDLSTGILFGTNAALRVDTDLSNVIGGSFFGVGSFQSLESVGVSLDDKGKLALDKTALTKAFTDDPAALQSLFTSDTIGIVAKVTAVIDTLAGDENSLLSSRSRTLQDTVDSNNDRITIFNERLARERDRLLLQFFRLEETISSLQQSQTALSAFSPIPPISS